MRDHIRSQIVAHRIRVPLSRIQQTLHPVGRVFTESLGQLPAVFALDVGEQAIEVTTGTGTHFGTTKAGGDLGVRCVKVSGEERDALIAT